MTSFRFVLIVICCMYKTYAVPSSPPSANPLSSIGVVYRGHVTSPITLFGFREDLILSQNGYTQLKMQSDGNLVLYHRDDNTTAFGGASWSSNTHAGGSNCYLTLHNSGDLILYDANNMILWHSNHSNSKTGIAPFVLSVSDDGTASISDNTQTIMWGTRWMPIHEYITSPYTLYGQYSETIRSTNNLVELRIQPDGNLVLYNMDGGEHVLWAANTGSFVQLYTTVLHDSGDLVTYYQDNSVFWNSSSETGIAPFYLVVSNAFVAYIVDSNNAIVWTTEGSPSGPYPTRIFTLAPSNDPTKHPSTTPSLYPTNVPSIHPTNVPSVLPTDVPSMRPTSVPSAHPTNLPSIPPTDVPSMRPTSVPSAHPTNLPSIPPTDVPSMRPANVPSIHPSSDPTTGATKQPSKAPLHVPTLSPTFIPSSSPTQPPSLSPTRSSSVPTTDPSKSPSITLSASPTAPNSVSPTRDPIVRASTNDPTKKPSIVPTQFPTKYPTVTPSLPANAMVTNAVTKESEFNDIIHKEVHPDLGSIVSNPMYMGVAILALVVCCFCVIGTVICCHKKRKARKAIELVNLFGTDAMGVHSAVQSASVAPAIESPRDTSTPADTLGDTAGQARSMPQSAEMITTVASPYVQNGAFMPLDTRAAAMSMSVGAMSMPIGMGNAPFVSVPMANMFGHINTGAMDNFGELADLPFEKRESAVTMDKEGGVGVSNVEQEEKQTSLGMEEETIGGFGNTPREPPPTSLDGNNTGHAATNSEELYGYECEEASEVTKGGPTQGGPTKGGPTQGRYLYR
eukprot:194119_1